MLRVFQPALKKYFLVPLIERRVNHKNIFWIVLLKYRLTLLLGLLIGAIAWVTYSMYPSTTLTVGVQHSWVDAEGKLIGRYKEIQTHLEKYGVELKYKVQADKFSEKPDLEFMIEDGNVDFVLAANTGAVLSDDIRARYRSLGLINRRPIYFYKRKGRDDIKKLRDLRGKTIATWSSPEGKETPAFTVKGIAPSPYSSDWVLYQILNFAAPNSIEGALVGSDSENSNSSTESRARSRSIKVLNPWPEPVTANLEWDVLIASGWAVRDSNSIKIAKELRTGEIELFQIEDIESVVKWRQDYELFRLVESSMSRIYNIPRSDLAFLAYFEAVTVKKNLDPSLVLLLAEALQLTQSKGTPIKERNEFPSFAKNQMFDPHPVAEHFYKHGRPFLSNYVSPSLAAFITKLLLILIPILTIAWPLMHFLPSSYAFYVKRKVMRWYKELEDIEKNIAVVDKSQIKHTLERLDKMQQTLVNMRLPLMHNHYVQELFIVREHIELIRKKLERMVKSDDRSQPPP